MLIIPNYNFKSCFPFKSGFPIWIRKLEFVGSNQFFYPLKVSPVDKTLNLYRVNKGIESLPQMKKFSSLYLCNRWCKPLIFQTKMIWSIRIHSFKYLRSTTLGCKDIRSRKSEFVAKTQFLSIIQDFSFQLNIFMIEKKLHMPTFKGYLGSYLKGYICIQ